MRFELLLVCAAAGCAEPINDWTIVGGSLIDVVAGEVRENGAVVVEDGVITAVLAPGDDLPDVGERFDATGLTLMPGLWEAHAHLVEQDEVGSLTVLPRAWEYHRGTPHKFRAFLDHGVTTARDPGGSIDSLKLRNEDVKGPHVFSAGKLFVAEDGYPSHNVPEYLHSRALYQLGEVADVAPAVEDALKELDGIDFLKIVYTSGVIKESELGDVDPLSLPEPWLIEAPLIKREVLDALIDYAHERELRVAVHLDRYEEARDVVEAGADYIHHAWPIPNDEEGDAFLATLAERDICWNVTLVVMASRAPSLLPVRLEAVRRAHAAGVRLPIGTDTGSLGAAVPWGESMFKEMALHLEAGLTPLEVLQAATIVNAECLGRGETSGSITAGKDADIVVVDGNPAADLGELSTASIRGVWVGGEQLR